MKIGEVEDRNVAIEGTTPYIYIYILNLLGKQ